MNSNLINRYYQDRNASFAATLSDAAALISDLKLVTSLNFELVQIYVSDGLVEGQRCQRKFVEMLAVKQATTEQCRAYAAHHELKPYWCEAFDAIHLTGESISFTGPESSTPYSCLLLAPHSTSDHVLKEAPNFIYAGFDMHTAVGTWIGKGTAERGPTIK